MGTKQITRVVLVCDGCGTTVGRSGGSAVEAREAGREAGWSFPPKTRGNGADGARVNDVCPVCVTTWKPRPSMPRR